MNKNYKSVQFKVVARSSNANSFGLYGHVLVSRAGVAFEVARSRGPWHAEWPQGELVAIPAFLDADGNITGYEWAGCELPRQLPKPPAKLLREIFPKE